MRIERIELQECVQPLKDAEWSFAAGAIPSMQGWVIQIWDDAGNTGYGYAHALPMLSSTAGAVRSALDHLIPKMIGRDDLDRPAIMSELETAVFSPTTARLGLDMALMDLASRRGAMSIGTMVGGRRRTSIPLARIIPLKSPDQMATVAHGLVQEGYGTMKLKMSGDAALDGDRIMAVREAIGPKVHIALDPNMTYSAKSFLSLFERISQYDISLVEQPVPHYDLDGLKHLNTVLPIVVEADESARSVADVVNLVRHRVVDAINLKITKFGSLGDVLNAIAVCETNGVEVRFGAAFGPSLLQSFHAHLAASLKLSNHASEIAEHLHLTKDPFTPLDISNGILTVPTGIGAGVTPLDASEPSS